MRFSALVKLDSGRRKFQNICNFQNHIPEWRLPFESVEIHIQRYVILPGAGDIAVID